MISWLMHRMTNVVVDAIVNRVLQDPYTENLFSFLTIAQKLTPRAIVEAGMRAESGKPLERPLGSPVVLSPWEKLLFNPVHLYRLPTPDGVQIATEVTIGPRARRPLTLEIPMLISGMSYGGALGLKAKIALARGAYPGRDGHQFRRGALDRRRAEGSQVLHRPVQPGRVDEHG